VYLSCLFCYSNSKTSSKAHHTEYGFFVYGHTVKELSARAFSEVKATVEVNNIPLRFYLSIKLMNSALRWFKIIVFVQVRSQRSVQTL